jgi:hypothetical protein
MTGFYRSPGIAAKSVQIRLVRWGSPKNALQVGSLQLACTNVVWFDLEWPRPSCGALLRFHR